MAAAAAAVARRKERRVQVAGGMGKKTCQHEDPRALPVFGRNCQSAASESPKRPANHTNHANKDPLPCASMTRMEEGLYSRDLCDSRAFSETLRRPIGSSFQRRAGHAGLHVDTSFSPCPPRLGLDAPFFSRLPLPRRPWVLCPLHRARRSRSSAPWCRRIPTRSIFWIGSRWVILGAGNGSRRVWILSPFTSINSPRPI